MELRRRMEGHAAKRLELCGVYRPWIENASPSSEIPDRTQGPPPLPMNIPMSEADEFQNRCPACKQVSHADDWEIGGACIGFQFCPVCSREVEPINLYLERMGCEQTGRINHDGPIKADREMSEWIETELVKRAAVQDAAYRQRTNQPPLPGFHPLAH